MMKGKIIINYERDEETESCSYDILQEVKLLAFSFSPLAHILKIAKSQQPKAKSLFIVFTFIRGLTLQIFCYYFIKNKI